MTSLSRMAFVALVLLAASGPTQAQDAAGAPRRPMAVPEILQAMPEMTSDMALGVLPMLRPLAHIDGTLAFLKVELGITAAQESQWEAFAAALRAAAQAIQASAGADGPMMGVTLNWPDRLSRMADMLSARLEAVRSLQGPVAALYAALSDAQKRKADALLGFPARMM
ncbi:MAG: Spy/CpxP family protein refolding chaperone [Rhodospirillales bacterium]|nr:Spy/CpxP family protein refolding chaperone [Rhodospirillales bacterium]